MGETLAGMLEEIARGLEFLGLEDKARALYALALKLESHGIMDYDDFAKLVRDAEAYREERTAKKVG